ncbi:hypothetical protein ACSBOB_01680 [Mesorhizobium sp. ASY16-5R]|uniref:hypothetical protein n=1 Tax=Mesorhizobium sp. ASY16-5R TaxID=3445772 RepID=UPI003F9FC0D6
MTAPANPIRRIEPVSISGLKPHKPTTGVPIVEYINPRSLYVDPAYQRSIGERGLRQIRNIVEAFDWSKFKLPTCAYGTNFAGETILFVLDGQHTAIGCASHPDIDVIPVAIVEAPMTVEAQADAFIGINRDRLNVTPLQLHVAAVAAGKDDAVAIERACQRAGVELLRGTPGSGRFKERQTIAITAIGQLIGRRGEDGAVEVLALLRMTGLAPIAAHHIKAVDMLLYDKEFSDQIAPDDLVDAIDDGIEAVIEDEARLSAKTHRVPFWKALGSAWFRKCRKRRGGRQLGLQENPSPETGVKSTPVHGGEQNPGVLTVAGIPTATPKPAHRTIVPFSPAPAQRNVTAAVMGDPSPGRSALDERRPA